MAADLLRQVVYATILVLMGVTLWVSAVANELEARVRRGWLDPLPLPQLHQQQP